MFENISESEQES